MADLTNAIAYIDARFGPGYRAWINDLSAEDQTRTLVTAASYLDRLPWSGTATHVLNGSPTTLQWPRSGVIIDGVEIDSTTVPTDITAAEYELAVLIAVDPSLPGKLDQGTNIASVSAGGGVGVAYFAPTSAARGTAIKLPYVIQQLVGKYLATPAANEGGFSQAGNSRSQFSRCRTFGLVEPE